VDAAIAEGSFARALLLALHINETPLVQRAVEAPPADAIALICTTVPPVFLNRLLEVVAARLAPGPAGSPHLEFTLRWALALLQTHGRAVRERPLVFGGAVRALHRAIVAHRDALGKL
jgi:periodic tryptophan protein 2